MPIPISNDEHPDNDLGDEADPYAHWNEEAELVRHAETDFDSPFADMSDADIKQAVYDRMRDGDDDHPDEGCGY